MVQREPQRPVADQQRDALAWLARNPGRLREYAGRWVALDGSFYEDAAAPPDNDRNPIVGADFSAAVALRQARARGVDTPLLVPVMPADDEGR